MRVTIISDASHCPNKKVGGWAFWAISQRGSHAGDGAFKQLLKDALISETMAIVNALHCSLKLGIAATGDEVLIQTDCQNAIQLLGGPPSVAGIGPKTRKRTDLPPVIRAFQALVREHAVSIEFRYVKGHSNSGDNRSVAQRNADRRAKRRMKSLRDKGNP